MRRLLLVIVVVAVMVPCGASAQSSLRWDPGLVLARSVAAGPPRVRDFFPSASARGVGVVLRFARPPAAREFALLERAGAVLYHGKRQDRVLFVGSMVGAWVPWHALADVARVPGLVRIALGRAPGERAQMDVSVREVGALQARTRHDESGQPLTGHGIIVADMDTAVDIHHPMFYFADGGQFAWLDVDGDDRFTDGVDAVDLDGDGLAASDETLRLQDARRQGAEGDGRLQAGEDWLWVDANGNGVRDYGLEGGYQETDPCLGELFMLVDDADLDDTLDPGETLTALGTSKIIGIFEFPGRTYLRGQNLLEADGLGDDSHGTGVTSVLAGGWTRAERRFSGIAPDAELLIATRGGASSGVVVTAPWAVELGADVVLYEYGAIAGRFLDGSDEDDLVIDELTQMGIPQVTPTGNWGDADKTVRTWIEPGARLDEIVRIPERWELGMFYVTMRWRRPEVPLEATITSPSGSVFDLVPGADTTVDAFRLTVSEDVSERGTVARNSIIFRSDEGILEIGDWQLAVTNPDGEAVELWATVVDDVSGFTGGARFVNWVDRDASAASPSTANLAIGVGSYSTRVSSGGDHIGQLSGFSGRGPRIDGSLIVDVAAPGDYDVLWAQSRRGHDDWGYFTMGGGTSAAGPHVAGGVALLLQAHPGASPAEVEAALRAGAFVDAFVGDSPNATWGGGKLRIPEALDALDRTHTDPDAGPGDAGPTGDASPDATSDASTTPSASTGCSCRTPGASAPGGHHELLIPCALLMFGVATMRRRPNLKPPGAPGPGATCQTPR